MSDGANAYADLRDTAYRVDLIMGVLLKPRFLESGCPAFQSLLI